MPAINGRLEACGVRDLRAEALLETGAVGRPLGAASHERQVRSQGPSRDGPDRTPASADGPERCVTL